MGTKICKARKVYIMKILNEKRASSLLIILLLVAGLTLVGCSSESEEIEPTATVEVEPTATIEETAVSPTQPPADGVPAPDGIVNVVWEWETLNERDPENSRAYIVTEVPDPTKYTLIMRPDSTFSGTADCNQISGTYTTENGYAFTLGLSTMVACGADSMDQQYINLLNNVMTGGPNVDIFALEAGGGSDRMEFRNGGAAPTQ